MDISSFPCTQLVFAFSLGWTLKEVNINGDFNQYIWAFSLGWTQETDVRVTSSSLLISSGKPEEVFPTNIFSVLNECPPLSTEPKLFNTIPTQFLLSHFYPHWFSTELWLSMSGWVRVIIMDGVDTLVESRWSTNFIVIKNLMTDRRLNDGECLYQWKI